MKKKIFTVPKECKYLSDYISELPSGYLINKGITGCGGTTIELNAPRNSIILAPTIGLVQSKESSNVFGLYGDKKNSDLKQYLITQQSYKKVIATYDALPRILECVPNYSDYFLLIDEYHLLFNDYSLRNKAIKYILQNFTRFKGWCFLTATPLQEEFILKELQNIPKIEYQWEAAKPIRLEIKDTYFIQKEILDLITSIKDKNLHIFLNSISTINAVIKKINVDFRVVCSKTSKSRTFNVEPITSQVKPVNFYTSCAFEGADIYDPDGLAIIVSDTSISTTVLDIATKVRQVCGRIRNSKYKDEYIFILNTSKHRYANTTKEEFMNLVQQSELEGKDLLDGYQKFTDSQMLAQLKVFEEEKYYNLYLNRTDSSIYYDENLKKLDIYNYKLVSEIYNNSISVLHEAENNQFSPKIIKSKSAGLTWIEDLLENKIYSYLELETMFRPIFEEKGIHWSQKAIKLYFPEHHKSRKSINGVQTTYYQFL